MPVSFAFPEPMTILTSSVAGEDSDGNDIRTETSVATSGAFAPAGSSELIQGQDTVIDQPTVYLTPGAPVPAPTDRLQVRGTTYDVDGKPQVFHNPFTGDEPGAVIRLLEVT